MVAPMAEQPVVLNPIDFSTHVLSLASSALIALGRMPGPDGKVYAVEVETAKHLIDVLAMLEAKGVYVITNDHIASASTELHVVLPDRTEVPAKLIGRDVRLDVALLQIDVPRLVPLPLGDSSDLQVGQMLVVLGDPFGDDVTAAVGVVSATGREGAGSLAAGKVMGYRTFIQTDARIHRGNSGGPVLDTAGQVVGVAVATGDRPGELSFAIPINRFKEVADQLRDAGQVARSWLGARVRSIDGERAQAGGLPRPS